MKLSTAVYNFETITGTWTVTFTAKGPGLHHGIGIKMLYGCAIENDGSITFTNTSLKPSVTVAKYMLRNDFRYKTRKLKTKK